MVEESRPVLPKADKLAVSWLTDWNDELAYGELRPAEGFS
jgi:hypothetical protein